MTDTADPTNGVFCAVWELHDLVARQDEYTDAGIAVAGIHLVQIAVGFLLLFAGERLSNPVCAIITGGIATVVAEEALRTVVPDVSCTIAAALAFLALVIGLTVGYHLIHWGLFYLGLAAGAMGPSLIFTTFPELNVDLLKGQLPSVYGHPLVIYWLALLVGGVVAG